MEKIRNSKPMRHTKQGVLVKYNNINTCFKLKYTKCFNKMQKLFIGIQKQS